METMFGIGLLVVAGLVLIGVEFYMPGFVLATVGIILLLTADFICLNHYGVNWAAGLFVAEVALALGTGYVVIQTIPQNGRRQAHDPVPLANECRRGRPRVGIGGGGRRGPDHVAAIRHGGD